MFAYRMAAADRPACSASAAAVPPVAPDSVQADLRGQSPSAQAIAVEDVAVLLAAVTARLRDIVGGAGSPAGPGAWAGPAGVPDALGDCAAALDQLDASLRPDTAPRQQFAPGLCDARSALAQAVAACTPCPHGN